MSEENKNLNEQPEQAPVEKKEASAPVANKAAAPKFNLDKKTLTIIGAAVAAVLIVVLVLVLVLGGGKDDNGTNNGDQPAHEHSYVNGKCECGAEDPNSPPIHKHNYVNGKCEGCGAEDPNHEHVFVNGKCECGEEDPNYTPGGEVTNTEYTLGMGTVVSLESSKTGTAQVDATVATVVLDKDGKIVFCRIDVAQNKVNIADGFVTIPAEFKTKQELLYDYNMSAFGSDNNGDGIVLEWFEQAKLFEEYVIGMTVEEVQNLSVQFVNDHYISADDELLTAGCTMQITDFRDAIVKACNDDQAVKFECEGEFTLGLAINSYNDGSKDAEEADGAVQVYSDIAAAVVADGKIIATLNDAIQPKIGFDWEGNITTKTFGGTKRELKEDYHMSAFGSDNNGDGIVLEWYLQSAEFSKYVVGLTPAEVANLATQFVNDHHISADNTLLNAGCTMQITGIKAVVAKAAGYVAGSEEAPKNEYTLGMGTVVSLESSKTGTAQVDATVATVVLDKDGKIVFCRIDVAQNKVNIADGFVTIPAEFKTKQELLYDYNMSKWGSDNNHDGIVLEWFEQAKLFEEYVIGMTVEEVQNLSIQFVNDHYISADEELLTAGCTMQITDFRDAIVKACNDDQAVKFECEGEFTLGLAINSYNDGSKDAEDYDGEVRIFSDIAAAVVADGKIIATLNDAIQPKIGFDWEGNITTKTFSGTKRELKENYYMAAYGFDNNGDGIVLEWYLQSATFSKYVVGLTADEVANLPTQVKDYGYVISADEDLLSAGCTIQITGMKDVVAKAAYFAR